VYSLTQLVHNLNDAKLDSNVGTSPYHSVIPEAGLGSAEVVVAPPTIYLLTLRDVLGKNIALSGQNCYIDKEGAFTGEVSPWQLAEERVPWVILGHSERRHVFCEVNGDIAAKTAAAQKFGLSVMLCVGEQLSEREAGKTLDVIEEQLRVVVEKKVDWSKIVIAYEPVWAIGTGTPLPLRSCP
jgi:triosephosphate isomerase